MTTRKEITVPEMIMCMSFFKNKNSIVICHEISRNKVKSSTIILS